MTHLLCRAMILACLALLSCPSFGAEGTTGIQGSTGPAALGAPPQSAGQAVSCDQPTSPRSMAGGPISVTVNAATAWQPRGGEVLVAVNGEPTRLAGLTVLACFAWSRAQAQDYFSTANLAKTEWHEAFVIVRPSDQTGLRNLGVIVPPVPTATSDVWSRWFSMDRSSGLGLVPVIDMRLIGYTPSGVLFDEVRPVGVTNVPFALAVALLTLVLAIAILCRLAAEVRGATSQPPAATRLHRAAQTVRVAASGSWILALVQGPGGRASLSAFQVLFWTLVVVASAAYVMTLSGNLINITTGTLTLLGIAGAAGLLASFANPPSTPAAPNQAPLAPNPPGPVPATDPMPLVAPQWRDFVLNTEGTAPDMSRIQMLFFTVVGGGFVVLQVLNYYVIPDIPAGYQILIGISNGVYVGSKLTPRP